MSTQPTVFPSMSTVSTPTLLYTGEASYPALLQPWSSPWPHGGCYPQQGEQGAGEGRSRCNTWPTNIQMER